MNRHDEFTSLLAEADMSQRDLAKRLDYSDRAVSFWATGKQEPPKVVIEFLKLYVGLRRLLHPTKE